MTLFKGILQYNTEDCGAACLATVLNWHGKKVPLNILKRELEYGKDGANIFAITKVADKYGLSAEAYKGNFQELQESIEAEETNLPFIVHVELENHCGHFWVVKRILKDKIKIFDPAEGNRTVTKDQFNDTWTGYVISFVKSDEWNRTTVQNKKYALYIRKLLSQKKSIVSVFVLSMLITLIAYAGAWAYKVIVDNYILKNSQTNTPFELVNTIVSNLPLLVISLVFLYLFQSGLNTGKGFIVAKVSQKLNASFSDLLYRHLLNLPNLFFHRNESGDILSRLQSIMNLQQMMINSLLTVSIELLSSIIGGIIIFRLSPRLFGVLLLIVLLYTLIFTFFLPKLKQSNNKFYSKYSEALTFFNQTLRGIGTIKLSGGYNWFSRKFFHYIDKATQFQYKTQIYGVFINSLILLIESVGMLVILWQGSLLVMNGTLSLGTLIAFQTLMSYFINPVKELILLQDEIQNLSIIISRLNDIFQYPSEFDRTGDCSRKVDCFDLRLNQLAYSDGFNPPIIYNINLLIHEGDHVGIIGPSGSGKTTLIRVLSSLFQATEGTYFIGGRPVQQYSLEYIRSKISYVDQDPYIFPGTVRDNLLMDQAFNIDETHFERVCCSCGIYEINFAGKAVLDMPLLEDGSNLSGGQKQKIGIARALLKHPKILLLDEATSNLDSLSEKSIYSYLSDYHQNLTIINISHNHAVTEYMDYLVMMKNGTIESIDTTEELKVNSRSFNRLFE